MRDDLERGYLLAFAAATINVPRSSAAWYAALGSAAAVVELHRHGTGLKPDGVRAFPAVVVEAVRAIDDRIALTALSAAADVGASHTCVGDPDYPARLRDLDDPPLVVYYRGTSAAIGERTVAIVGSRAASAYGRRIAAAFAADARAYGAAVVSGLARGVDAAAHRAALEAGTPTVAVLGNGLASVFPSYHAPLAADIAVAGGAVMSEFPPAMHARAASFPQRNRIVAALADATVAVEAGTRSGALITVRLANDLGRPVFAVPGDVERPTSAGTNALIQDGVALATCFADVAQWLRWDPVGAMRDERGRPAGDDPIVAALREQPLDADELGARFGLDSAAVAARLGVLEIAGAVRRDGSRFCVTARP